jgi:uracil-DNA glycosylase
MTELAALHQLIYQEARQKPFPLDLEVYQAADRDPLQPILSAGNLQGQLCFFGRDLGRDEVQAGQPLIGAAGSLVREGFFQALHGRKSQNRRELMGVCDRLLLTNTVPYKPPGNKAYSVEVKERFRPFIEQLLVCYWQGSQIITLGTEAFQWFHPYGVKGEVEQFFKGKDRFVEQLQVNLTAIAPDGTRYSRLVSLMPLPHPSPLNQRYYAQFPQMLQARLQAIAF